MSRLHKLWVEPRIGTRATSVFKAAKVSVFIPMAGKNICPGSLLLRDCSSSSLHAPLERTCLAQDTRVRNYQASLFNTRKSFVSTTTEFEGSHQPASTIAEASSDQSYVENWIHLTQRLMGLLIGSLRNEDWIEAKGLFKSMRHESFQLSRNRVEEGFALMDRLCQEVQATSHRRRGYSFALNRGSWIALLLAWRDFVFQHNGIDSGSDVVPLSSQTTERHVRAKRSKRQASQLGQLHPLHVAERVEMYMESSLVQVHPSAYSVLLHVLEKAEMDRHSAPELAHQLIFQRLLDRSRRDASCVPDAPIIYHMIEVWSRSGQRQAPARAEEYLQSLKDSYSYYQRPELRPTVQCYCALMETYGKCSYVNQNGALSRILSLFGEMKQHCNPEELDAVSYARVANSLANCEHSQSPDAARAVLDESIERFLRKGETRFQPGSHIVSPVLLAYGQAGRADDAEALLNSMERLANETNTPSLSPDVVSYNALIWAFARVGDSQRAESVLHRLLASQETGAALNLEVWNGLLCSWAESHDPNAVKYIKMAMEKLKEQNQTKHAAEGTGLTTSTYNTLLTCFARQKTLESAEAAEKLFMEMVSQDDEFLQPDSKSLLNVVSAWSGAGQPEKAENILRREMTRGQIELVQTHFNVILQAWTNLSQAPKERRATERANAVLDLMKEANVRPDSYTFSSLMWSIARSPSVNDPAELVEKMFHQMRTSSDEPPDGTAYNAIAFALSRSPDPNAMDRMKPYLQQMRETGVKRTFHLYNTLMMAWSKRNRPGRMEELFQEMLSSNDKELQPQADSFKIRLDSWSRAANPEMTVKALQDWITAATTKDGPVTLPKEQLPRTQNFNAVLSAWLRSNKPEAAEKAERGLQRMVELSQSKQFDCHPDRYSFAAVIGAHARSSNSASGERAVALFHELKRLAKVARDSRTGNWKVLQPDFMIYKQTIVALCHSSPDPRAAEAIRRLLAELLDEAAGPKKLHSLSDFWQNAHKNLPIIRKEMEKSLFENKNDLLADFAKLETMVRRIL